MKFLLDASQPRFGPGCHWHEEKADGERTLVCPEGQIKVAGTARRILEACDGQRTLHDIVEELQANYTASEPAKVRQDVTNFLTELHEIGVIEY